MFGENMLAAVKDKTMILEMIYTDLAQPGVKKVGSALETVLDLSNTILLPLRLVNERSQIVFEQNMKKFKERVEKTSEEKIFDVPPEIGLPILEKLTYVRNEDISDLFVDLLVSASSIDTIELAHPSFIQIINNLSSDEARLVKRLNGIKQIPFITYRLRWGNKGDFFLAENLTGLELSVDLLFPDNINIYLENLVSKGILLWHNDRHLTDGLLYKELERRYAERLENIREYQSIQPNPNNYGRQYFIDQGYYDVTDYGNMFIKACVLKLGE